tara:strand:+ start:1735 stop:1920 length:186 start_codon:yes stop_codon:yes gene_type:complete
MVADYSEACKLENKRTFSPLILAGSLIIFSEVPSQKYSFFQWELLFKKGSKAMVVAGMASV